MYVGAGVAVTIAVLSGEPAAVAQTRNMGGGFLDHGIAAPVADSRGVVATADGHGRGVALIWLYDNRGGYALLVVDTTSGKTDQIPTPFDYQGDAPYASLLSSQNRYYTAFGSHFVEFDVARRRFTVVRAIAPRTAMSLTESDEGLIWMATYPNCGVLAFDPRSGSLSDYGYVNKENWAQYPRFLATDSAGWVYIGLGFGTSKIVGLYPPNRAVRSLLPRTKQEQGKTGYVYRAVNGKVYGMSGEERRGSWHELYAGRIRLDRLDQELPRKPVIAGGQGLIWRDFPDGKTLTAVNVAEGKLWVKDPHAEDSREVSFDYTTVGTKPMAVLALPDGTICGGTYLPWRFFRYDPQRDVWERRWNPCQWNVLAEQGGHVFVGGYDRGRLVEWDPHREWLPLSSHDPDTNPYTLIECTPIIHRPCRLLAHPDKRTLIMGGFPAYGYTGGGLMFWDQGRKESVLLRDEQVIPQQSTQSLAVLSDGRLLGGTSVLPGTGGEQKAKEAELYLMDISTKRVEWHEALVGGALAYTDLCVGPQGLVYGLVDRRLFIVFDSSSRQILHSEDIGASFGAVNYQQGYRVFIAGNEGRIFALFGNSIAEIAPTTHRPVLLARTPAPVTAGGDYYQGRLYFACETRLFSYAVPPVGSVQDESLDGQSEASLEG